MYSTKYKLYKLAVSPDCIATFFTNNKLNIEINSNIPKDARLFNVEVSTQKDWLYLWFVAEGDGEGYADAIVTIRDLDNVSD